MAECSKNFVVILNNEMPMKDFFLFYSIFYFSSITVVPITLPCPTHPSPPTPSLPPFPVVFVQGSFVTCSLTWSFPFFYLLIPLPPPFWSLSDYSLFPCLWFCFTHLFVLLIRFHLEVRSYGICLWIEKRHEFWFKKITQTIVLRTESHTDRNQVNM